MALARNIATVGSGTLISRLLAYLRDAGIAALLGAGPFSEAFFAVLQVVNFFRRLLAEAALNGAFVPIWLKLRAGEDGAASADRFTKRSLVAMLIITGIVALLVTVLAPLVIATVVPGFDAGHRKLDVVLPDCHHALYRLGRLGCGDRRRAQRRRPRRRRRDQHDRFQLRHADGGRVCIRRKTAASSISRSG